MLDLYCALAFAVILIGLAAATRTSPAVIGRHLADFPGTAFVAASTGAFVALGVWGLSLPFAAQPPLRLALYGVAWALLQVILEADSAKGPRTRKECGAHRRR